MLCVALKDFKIQTPSRTKEITRGTKLRFRNPEKAKELMANGLVEPVAQATAISIELECKLKAWGCQNCDWHFQGDDGTHLCLVVAPCLMRCVVLRYLIACPKRNPKIRNEIIAGKHLNWMV